MSDLPKMSHDEVGRIRQLLHGRRQDHRHRLKAEVARLTAAAIGLGVQRVILFGSLTRGVEAAGLTSDLDLLIVWDTPLDYLARTMALYRHLEPQVPTDLLVYTPAEMAQAAHVPLIRQALQEGKVLYDSTEKR